MLRSADTVDDLIARADAALYRQRHPLGAASSHQ
jgi:hypothetical protein